MTVTEILNEARNNLNALNDTLWSDTELYLKLYRVMLKVARRTRCIEGSDSQSTVIAQAAYTPSAAAIETWRVTYEGAKLQFIDRRQYDAMNPNSTTNSGTPAYYLAYGGTVTLYPTPAAVGTLILYAYKIPSAVPTGSTTLEVPVEFHDVLVDGLTSEMCPKDLGHPLTSYWAGKYADGIEDMKATIRRQRRGDRFAVVKTEEDCLNNDFGVI